MSGTLKADITIIGSGIAGLSAALRADELGLDTIVVTRAPDPLECNTKYAQGGIVYSKNGDTKLVEDILKASSGTSNIDAAEFINTHSGKILKQLLLERVQVPFAKNDEGEYRLTREGAHSFPRILFAGDYSGKAIEESLYNYLIKSTKVTVLKNHTAIDLELTADKAVSGIQLLDNSNNQVITINSAAVVLATGGVGSLYLHNSNTSGARGDGHAIAMRAGANFKNMEFVQFHPTTFFDPKSHQRFLISEAVRGEGGILRNLKGERFMERYHPDLELASRDIVSKSIVDEIDKSAHPCVYLDVSHLDQLWFTSRFPTIAAHCQRMGVDLLGRGIPVVPSAHYSCGGIEVNLEAETSVTGLYAAGEVACSGLHGANRLASTALLEGLTFGWVAAERVAQKKSTPETISSYKVDSQDHSQMVNCDPELFRLKTIMWEKVGIVRSKKQLLVAQLELGQMKQQIEAHLKSGSISDELLGLHNGIGVGLVIIEASLKRNESVGCFNIE